MPLLRVPITEIARIARFGIVGVAATLVYAAASMLAIEILYLNPVSGSIFGQLVSTGVSYFGHSMFSFALKTDHQTYLWRFLVIASLTFAMNAVVTWLLTDVLLVSYRVSIAIVTVLIPLTNYVCNRFWVFAPGLRKDAATHNASATSTKINKHS